MQMMCASVQNNKTANLHAGTAAKCTRLKHTMHALNEAMHLKDDCAAHCAKVRYCNTRTIRSRSLHLHGAAQNVHAHVDGRLCMHPQSATSQSEQQQDKKLFKTWPRSDSKVSCSGANNTELCMRNDSTSRKSTWDVWKQLA
jgi:hypothetical protein